MLHYCNVLTPHIMIPGFDTHHDMICNIVLVYHDMISEYDTNHDMISCANLSICVRLQICVTQKRSIQIYTVYEDKMTAIRDISMSDVPQIVVSFYLYNGQF